MENQQFMADLWYPLVSSGTPTRQWLTCSFSVGWFYPFSSGDAPAMSDFAAGAEAMFMLLILPEFINTHSPKICWHYYFGLDPPINKHGWSTPSKKKKNLLEKPSFFFGKSHESHFLLLLVMSCFLWRPWVQDLPRPSGVLKTPPTPLEVEARTSQMLMLESQLLATMMLSPRPNLVPQGLGLCGKGGWTGLTLKLRITGIHQQKACLDLAKSGLCAIIQFWDGFGDWTMTTTLSENAWFTSNFPLNQPTWPFFARKSVVWNRSIWGNLPAETATRNGAKILMISEGPQSCPARRNHLGSFWTKTPCTKNNGEIIW